MLHGVFDCQLERVKLIKKNVTVKIICVMMMKLEKPFFIRDVILPVDIYEYNEHTTI
jgi:hypothetical protein